MIFKCKNCGGNMVYSPKEGSMYCPYCEGTESWEQVDSPDVGITACPSCYGQLELDDYDSATKCPYCDNYIIVNERVEGQYRPQKMIRFLLGKESCKQSIREKFKKHKFLPVDFLSEVRLNSMEGSYVPFWFYDYETEASLVAEGTKVKSWISGNMMHTETSYYEVSRQMDIPYDMIPADASYKMPDPVMDLMAPYDYTKLEDFEPRYLSGFLAERYNMPAEEIEHRAKARMEKSARSLLKASAEGYKNLRPISENIQTKSVEYTYGLLPVWRYDYLYHGKNYPFYVNGQTGKIVGEVPVSTSKRIIYTGTVFVMLTALWYCFLVLIYLGLNV